MPRRRTNTQETPSPEVDYSESIKAASTVLSLLEANLKKETDVYVRQLQISRNYTWIASLLWLMLLGIFDRTLGQPSAHHEPLTCFQLFRLMLLFVNGGFIAWAFFFSFQISWRNNDVEYMHQFKNLFMENGDYSPTPRTDSAIYCTFIGFIKMMTNAYGTLSSESERRGKTLNHIGIALMAGFGLMIFNICLYLLEFLL